MTNRAQNNKCIIYHYCPCWAFENIIRTKEFWFSSKRDSNDRIEFQIPELILRGLQHDPVLVSKQEMIDSCLSYLKQVKNKIFMLSFSRAGDKLSQWRSYADDGKGFAIGIEIKLTPINDFKETPKIQQNSPFIFMQVLYNNVNDLRIQLLSRIKNMKLKDVEQVKQDLMYYTAGSKYCKFYEEEEVRLIRFSPDKTQTRLSPQGPRKYISYSISNAKKLYVTIGPKNKCTTKQIEKFLKTHGFTNVSVSKAIQHYK